jgi:hypothetical protein
MRMTSGIFGLAGLSLTLLASFLLLLLGMVYFMATIWMIKFGASWAGYPDIAGNTIVLTAGIITAASMLGSSMKRY